MSRVSINVNDLSMVHEDSGGVSTATLPDICLTPPDFAPVPYPNVALSRDLSGGSRLVTADGGHSIALAGSSFARSTGGEPGSAGGVTSGVQGKEAMFLTHSLDVLVEGRGVARLTDKMLHNRGNTIDCAGVVQPVVTLGQDPDDEDDRRAVDHDTRRHPWETPLRHSRRGVDSNCRTLNMPYAHKRNIQFVCRYIAGLSEKEANEQGVQITPNNIRLSREEAENLGIDLVACWEINAPTSDVGPNHRAIESGSLDAQHHLGYLDGLQADKNLREAGGEGHPIYFTVDFPVGEGVWNKKVKDAATKLPITIGQIITKYFEGINHAVPMHRVGVYGRYTAVKYIMEAGLARYGWQMTFNHDPYPAAHIHQTSIFPDITRWGPHLPPDLLAAFKNPKLGAQITDQARKDLLNQAGAAYAQGMQEHWGISGAGGLDFDRAVKADFGQWRPGKPPASKHKK
jgi:Domain of unknown function (DUF4150)/Domain of unknown function (DUF1906)